MKSKTAVSAPSPDTLAPSAKGWSPERRAAQAERIRALRPWDHATGPRTKGGKTRAARNAVTHALNTDAWKTLRALLREQGRYMRHVSSSRKA